MDTEYDEMDDCEVTADLTVRDWFDVVGRFACRLGVMAVGFALVVLAAAGLCRLVLIPVLRAKGWCV